VLPFACRGDAGTVDVHYGVTTDPAALGFDLAAIGFDKARFTGFGYLPTFFDAPANPDHPDGEWVAETFLVGSGEDVRNRGPHKGPGQVRALEPPPPRDRLRGLVATPVDVAHDLGGRI
jgi:hypothetical protein